MTLTKKSLYSFIIAAALFCCFVLLPPKANAANQTATDNASLQTAVDAVGDGEKITISNNLTISSTITTPSDAKSFTLDLNGKKLTGTAGVTLITHNGTGTLTVEGGTIEHSGNAGYAINNAATGEVKIVSGNVSTLSTSENCAAIYTTAPAER